MSDALEKARRELATRLREWWAFDDRQKHTHSWHDREDFIDKELPELFARLEAAAREEGEKIGRDRMTAAYEQAIPSQQAAARLAGRLEQAEIDVQRAASVYGGSQVRMLIEKERDRLRREAGK